MNRHLLHFSFILFSAVAFAQNITTPDQLITAMHDRYSAKWYRTLSFEQQSITHKPDGTDSTEIWHETLSLPGRLAIVIGDAKAGNGMLFINNRLSVFRDGKMTDERDFIHPLLVLGFDVYTQPASTTEQHLKDSHFDMSTMHEETLNGRPMYVVGAKQGDLMTLQFWIDKERLYFVRLLRPSEKQPGIVQDTRFDDYKQVEGGGWLAEHVELFVKDKLVFEEVYSDIKINPSLPEGVFNAKQFLDHASLPAK
jgi:hypothetical protein